MSTSSVIGSMQSALDCAGKCDCCAKLQQQIDAINARLGNIKPVNELSLKNSIKASLQPELTTFVAGAVVVATNKLQPQIDTLTSQARQNLEKLLNAEKVGNNGLAIATQTAKNAGADRAEIARIARLAHQADDAANAASSAAGTSTKVANTAFDAAGNAQKKAALLEKQSADAFKRLNQVEDIAVTAARESKLASGLSNQAVSRSGQAVTEATQAAKDALDANNAVGGFKGTVEGLKGRVGALGESIARLETAVGNAVTSAAKAVGISEAALNATGRILGKIAEIFNIIGTFAVLFEQLATLNVLGGRIDAVENGVVALGNDVSRVLGKLLGLQNRIGNNETTIAQIKNIALDAKGIGEAANLKAGAAQVTSARSQGIAESALGNAKQAQLTADGAVRNAATANENATTAYKQGVKAEGVGEQAKRIGIDALGKAGAALTTALTAIALYQTVKSLRGLPGIPGRQGERGLQGAQGIPGRDGITTVVQVAGVPGRDGLNGRNGSPGIPGRNGRDVSPADLASLRALIISQHAATRTNINTASAGLVGGVKTFFTTQLAGITALITAIATNTYVEKALSVLTFAATVHNALMLSNNLGQTFTTIVDQVVGLILPKGLDGTPISFSNVLGKAVHEIIADSIGETNYQELSKEWQAANRIYQAASNVYNQISNLGGVVIGGLEVIGGNVGKIGNALRKGGVLLENAYSYMNPQPNLKGKFFEQMNLVGENLQAIALVTAIPIALAAAKDGVDSSVADLKREISQTDPTDAQGHPLHNADGTVIHYKPGLDVPDPAAVKTEGDQAKADSTNFLQLVLDDIFDGGD